MLVSKCFLPVLVQANKSSSRIGGQMFLYSSAKTTGFEVSSKRLTKQGYQIRSLLFKLAAIEQLCRLLHSIRNPIHSYMKSSLLEISLCFMLIIAFILIGEMYRIRGKFPNVYTTYFNSILLFESKFEEGYEYKILRNSKLAKDVLFLAQILCRWAIGASLAITCVTDPAIPFNVAWFLKPVLGTGFPMFEKFTTFIFNYCIWQAVGIQGFRLTTDVLIGTISLTYCLQIAHRNLSKALTRTHKKYKNYECIQYRSVHLLVNQYNNLMQTLFFLILLTVGVAQVVAAVTLILCKISEVPIFLLVCLIIIIKQTIIIIIVSYGYAGNFHQESTRSLEDLQIQNRLGFVRRREFRYRKMFLDACQVQKVQFGMSNFIEKTTPLVFQQYCLDRIADLILLK